MWKRNSTAAKAMAPVVDLPTGNVHLTLPRQTTPAGEMLVHDTPPMWTVRDARGKVVADELPTRAAALRLLGALAIRGAELPLTVYDAEGRPTGDRLA